MEEEEVEAARVMHSKRESAREDLDADSPTRVEEEAEVNSYPFALREHSSCHLPMKPSMTESFLTSSIHPQTSGGGRGGRGGGDRGSSGGGGGVCYAHQKGECTRGSACRFSH